MRILGFEIERNASLRTNPLSLVFLALMIFCFYSAMTKSGYFANYRFGDSVIPREEQLIRSGPYTMQTVNIRNGYLIKFRSIPGGYEYSERWTNFNKTIDILTFTNSLENPPVAYLWIFQNNPVRKVWKIEVNGVDVLSYKRALFDYRIDSDPGFMLTGTISCLVMFLLSMISIDRVKNSGLPKLEN